MATLAANKLISPWPAGITVCRAVSDRRPAHARVLNRKEWLQDRVQELESQIDRLSHQAASHPLHFCPRDIGGVLQIVRFLNSTRADAGGGSPRGRTGVTIRSRPSPGARVTQNQRCPFGTPHGDRVRAMDRASPVRYACPFNFSEKAVTSYSAGGA